MTRELLSFKVTISIGVTQYEEVSGETVSELVKRADEALYRGKKEGRNRVNLNLQTGVP